MVLPCCAAGRRSREHTVEQSHAGHCERAGRTSCLRVGPRRHVAVPGLRRAQELRHRRSAARFGACTLLSEIPLNTCMHDGSGQSQCKSSMQCKSCTIANRASPQIAACPNRNLGSPSSSALCPRSSPRRRRTRCRCLRTIGLNIARALPIAKFPRWEPWWRVEAVDN